MNADDNKLFSGGIFLKDNGLVYAFWSLKATFKKSELTAFDLLRLARDCCIKRSKVGFYKLLTFRLIFCGVENYLKTFAG